MALSAPEEQGHFRRLSRRPTTLSMRHGEMTGPIQSKRKYKGLSQQESWEEEKEFEMKVNKAIVIGEVVSQPEIQQSPEGPFCEFQVKSEDEYFHVIATAKRAEIICKYYRPALQLYIEGPMTTKQGAIDLARETLIHVQEFQFIGGAKGSVNVPH